jgi:hypothetical protein
MDRSDLTGFAALLGESVSARVDLLERLLRGAHYPSLGHYKERLLADTIRGFLPRSIEVGTGFVLFPHADDAPAAGELHDPLNQSAYSVSKQCDILIYDIASFPPIFRDREFVVVRPEAVRAVIEVKGAISIPQTRTALASFHDFATKWRRTQQFYDEHSQRMTPVPGMHVMAWDFQRRKDGGAVASPTRIADAIVDFYSQNVAIESADGYPFLTQLLIYNECEISAVHGIEDIEAGIFHFGWHIRDGRFVRINESGEPYRDRDRTIASLLASLHWNIGQDNFNRFFSYTDEISGRDVLDYRFAATKWAYTGLGTHEARQLTEKLPRRPV